MRKIIITSAAAAALTLTGGVALASIPPGPARGPSEITVTSSTVDTGTATALCPPGHPYAISGGGRAYQADPNNPPDTPAPQPLSEDQPYRNGTSYPTGWTVADANLVTGNEATSGTEDVAVAVCGRL